MNKTLNTTLTVIAVLALAAVIFFAGSMYTRINAFGPSTMYSWDNDNTYGPSMMNGNGPSMMGGYSYNNTDLTPLTIDRAKAAAEKYLANLNNSDLEIAEIMIFDNNGYVIVKETSTGLGAFELLVDPISQIAYPEHGPNMMWNLKYGGVNHNNMTLAPGASAGVGGSDYGMIGMMGGGMMNGYGGNMMQGWISTTPHDVSAEMTVTLEQAVESTQQYLDANFAGATVEHTMQFYGYYTLDFEKDGKIVGMLSVNGYSGQVFLHTWHGAFIEETEY